MKEANMVQVLPKGIAAIMTSQSKKTILPWVESFSIWCRQVDVAMTPSWITHRSINLPPEPDIVEVTFDAWVGMFIDYSDTGMLVVEYDGQVARFQVLLKYGTMDVKVTGFEEERESEVMKGMVGYIPKGSQLEIVQFEDKIEWHSPYK